MSPNINKNIAEKIVFRLLWLFILIDVFFTFLE